tara:strand:- start:11 stop:445 length:435 start_codon:yes stop_codon:yes gene_type:complete
LKGSGERDNKLYNKTSYTVEGSELPKIETSLIQSFGISKENLYLLNITTNEEIVKKSIDTNQVSKKTDYEIELKYILYFKQIDCVIFKTNISSRFSFVTKSSGYNFGADESLEKLYEMAIQENFTRFIQEASGYLTSNKCINES